MREKQKRPARGGTATYPALDGFLKKRVAATFRIC